MKRILLTLFLVGTAVLARSQQPEQPLPVPDAPAPKMDGMQLLPAWENPRQEDTPVWFDRQERDRTAAIEGFMQRRGIKPLPKLDLFHYKMRGGRVGISNGQAHNWHNFPGDFPVGYRDARTLSFPHSGRGGGRRR